MQAVPVTPARAGAAEPAPSITPTRVKKEEWPGSDDLRRIQPANNKRTVCDNCRRRRELIPTVFCPPACGPLLFRFGERGFPYLALCSHTPRYRICLQSICSDTWLTDITGIRCDGRFPCQQCAGATLTCKRDHVPKKRGPKRGHGRVINELRAQELKQTLVSETTSGSEYDLPLWFGPLRFVFELRS